MKSIMITLGLIVAVLSTTALAQEKDLKQLGQERTALYNAAMKKLANDKLFQRLFAEEKELGEKAAEARKAGNKELADILARAQGGKHMEKRYYLRLMDPAFNAACQAFDDADPHYMGIKSSDLKELSKDPAK